jgi:hypothetical protein
MKLAPKTKRMKFFLQTCDLWEDTYIKRTIEVTARLDSASGIYRITDKQLNRAVGIPGLTWDGGEEDILSSHNRKGIPVYRLIRVKEDEGYEDNEE